MPWTFDADRPIYAQVVEEITRRIVCGVYAPGDRIPTVRELAVEAAVNPNTMQKAMAELEAEKLVYAQRTAGRFVTEDAGAIQECREKLAREKVQEFWHSMESLGYSTHEIQELCRMASEERENGEEQGKMEEVSDSLKERERK